MSLSQNITDSEEHLVMWNKVFWWLQLVSNVHIRIFVRGIISIFLIWRLLWTYSPVPISDVWSRSWTWIFALQVVEEARAVVLAGGTLQPISELRDRLFPQLPNEKVNALAICHLILVSVVYTCIYQLGHLDYKWFVLVDSPEAIITSSSFVGGENLTTFECGVYWACRSTCFHVAILCHQRAYFQLPLHEDLVGKHLISLINHAVLH